MGAGSSASEPAYVGLGSNLDDPARQLRRALEALSVLPSCRLLRHSSLYRTLPLGPPQPDYVNAVALLETQLTPLGLLDALQELTRLAVQARTGDRSRLMLDVAGFRAARRAELASVGAEAVERVRSTGEPVELEPMNSFERKVVHDVVAAAGLASDSEGVEPSRHVVVRPA